MTKYLPVFAALAAVVIISIDVQLFSTMCYAVVGVRLLQESTARRRLAGVGAGIHYIVVSWRAGILIFLGDSLWWGDVHRATIAIAAAMVVYDFQIERSNRSA